MEVFSTDDPMYVYAKSHGKICPEENTFYYREYNIYQHFFTKNEIESLFSELRIKYTISSKKYNDEHPKKNKHIHRSLKIEAIKME